MKCGFLLGGIGTLIGTVVALASTRLLSRILYGVSATDMSTFISAFFVLLLLVGLATLMPGIAGLTNKCGGRDMNGGCHSAINNLRSATCNVHRGSRSMGTTVGDEPA